MNPIIKKQLESCKVANIPVFDDTTTEIHIPKGAVVNVSAYEVGKCYIVELSDVVLNPPDGSTISTNWNGGAIPKYKYYKCEIVKTVAKMVCIMGFGFDPVTMQEYPDLWQGWVPQEGIKLLQELK